LVKKKKSITFAALKINQQYTTVDTLSYRTVSTSKEAAASDRKWFVVDATNMTVGRMASRIAHILRGKHKPSYTPHTDCGDNIIVINAEKVRFTGKKMDEKEYITFSGYPGGQKIRTPRQHLAKNPAYIVENAVRGMLPKNKLGRAMYKKLFVYVGEKHPHEAQQPTVLDLKPQL